MSSVCDFRFVLVPVEGDNNLSFRIYYNLNGQHDYFFFDTVKVWVNEVREKTKDGKSVDDVIDEFRNGWWKDVMVDGICADWMKENTVDWESYQKAVKQYFDMLKIIGEGAVIESC